MNQSETVALVALLRLGRRPGSVYTELIEESGSALAVLESELEQATAGQASLMPDPDLDPSMLLERAAAEIQAWRQRRLKLLSVLDPEYPPNLRAVHDRPPLIFMAGRLTSADDRSVAVIGSRRASPAGLRRARALSAGLVGRGYTIISGLAAGIDTAAHTAAIAAGGPTVAVIGTGLDHSHPAANDGLQSEIAGHGAVISQFWPETGPSRQTFPMRNAVMSGLSRATAIVEASQRSGARIQARLALAQGRPVFVARELLDQEWARTLAARPGVTTYETAGEVDAGLERVHAPGALTA